MLSGVMMFDFMGWKEAARLIEGGIERTITQKRVTYDLERLDGRRQEVAHFRIRDGDYREYAGGRRGGLATPLTQFQREARQESPRRETHPNARRSWFMRKKVTVVGGGFVGSTTAQRIIDSGLADVVMTDILEGVRPAKRSIWTNRRR